MKDLFDLAEKENIDIEWWDFAPPLEAIYIAYPDLPLCIGLSNALEREPRRYLRSVLAEELGHHFTSTGNGLPAQYFHYRERLITTKMEYLAHKWAAMYLIKEDSLLHKIEKGIVNVWELAEEFEVTEELIKLRLDLLGSF